MTTKQEVLQNCTVEGNIVKLPAGQLERKLYQDVAKSLELIGGKWKGGKTMGFVFPTDPTDLLAQIANGEQRNLKKEFQFFATPDELADDMVHEAQIEPHHSILEPSAGQGAIIEAIFRTGLDRHEPVDYCELMDVNRHVLEGKIDKGLRAQWVAHDFLQIKPTYQWDRIIANPPFSKNQDIDHIYQMYLLLKDGGRMVTICSPHYEHSEGKKEKQFAEWLNKVGADVREVAAGSFKKSGTGIKTLMIIINK